MEVSKHTKGPWRVAKHSWYDTYILDSSNMVVCKLELEDCTGCSIEALEALEAVQSANSRLLAAAPMMYMYLKAVAEPQCDPNAEVADGGVTALMVFQKDIAELLEKINE